MVRFRYLGLALLAAPVSLQAAVPAQAKPASADPDKVICRTTAATGSFARLDRTCLTRAQWQLRYNHSREVGESLQQRTPTDHEQPLSDHGVSGKGY